MKFNVPETEFAPIKEETHEDEDYGKHSLIKMDCPKKKQRMNFSKRSATIRGMSKKGS